MTRGVHAGPANGAAAAARAPDILAGRRVRRVDIEIAPGISVAALEAADHDTVVAEAAEEDSDPYAAILWPSAIAAAARLPSLITPGSTVLDVGAGSGLAALAAASLGARAIALDHDPFSRALVAEAAAMQGLSVSVRAFDLRSGRALPQATLVVIADLLYEPELARAAAHRTLEALSEGAAVLVADPARFGRAEYVRIMNAAGVDTAFDDVVVRVPGDPQAARVGVALCRP